MCLSDQTSLLEALTIKRSNSSVKDIIVDIAIQLIAAVVVIQWLEHHIKCMCIYIYCYDNFACILYVRIAYGILNE